MNWFRLILLLAALTLLSRPASAEGIGVSAPLSGPSEILGAQMRTGALAAAPSATVGDDACTAAGGAALARRFVQAKISVVIGYLCTEAIEAAMPILAAARIPVIAVGVRTDSLTDRRQKTRWPVFRLGPRADGERYAAATILTRLWRENLFAIIDDGTIYGRELAETFRSSAEQAALKPVFVDTFRPQLDNQIALLGRLRKAGATHVFVGGDREDIAIMARDAAELGYPLTIAGGEALRAAPGDVPLSDGILMIATPEWRDVADKAAIDAIQAKGAMAEGYALPAFAAMQVATVAIQKAAASGRTVAEVLATETFATAIGPIKFDQKGDLSENPYRLFRFQGGRFLPVETQ
jgi:branched-chain amino acid transport system substrate-binding protein